MGFHTEGVVPIEMLNEILKDMIGEFFFCIFVAARVFLIVWVLLLLLVLVVFLFKRQFNFRKYLKVVLVFSVTLFLYGAVGNTLWILFFNDRIVPFIVISAFMIYSGYKVFRSALSQPPVITSEKNKTLSRLHYSILAIMISAGVLAYLFPTALEWDAAAKLYKVQSFKIKNNILLKEHVEQRYPGGTWMGGEFAATYRIGSIVFFWDAEGDRVLAASGYTIRMFPETAPKMDKTALESFNENQLFNAFNFERNHPLKHPGK
jgi:hypothetical protein